MLEESIQRVKIIGRPIGAPDEPVDGDGDGFYTAVPGAGDVTPVPVRALTVEGLNKSKANGKVALAEYRKIRKEVAEKFGEIKTRREARAALQKAFPNAFIHDFPQAADVDEPYDFALGVDEDGYDESRPFDMPYGSVVGLLHMADKYPQVAQRITEITGRLSDRAEFAGAAGECSYSITDGKKGFGLKIGLSPSDRFGTIQSGGKADYLRIFGGTIPWPDDDDDFQDMEDEVYELAAAYVAIHEMGHALHNAAVLQDLQISAPSKETGKTVFDENGNEIQVQDPLPFYRQLFNLDDEQIKKVRESASEWAQAHYEYLKSENQDVSSFDVGEKDTNWHWNNAYIYGLFAAIAEMDGDHHLYYDLRPIVEKWEKDGLDDEEFAKMAELLSAFGRYAASSPGEGIAEAIVAMELGYPMSDDANMKKFFDWLGVRQKSGKPFAAGVKKTFPIEIPLCSGFPTFGIDPYVIKLPTEKKYKKKFDEVSYHSVKVIGAPIGASNEPDDGDGDGFYTAVPGGEDNTPVPLQLFDADEYLEIATEVDWEPGDILDGDFLEKNGYDNTTPEELADSLREEAKSSWGFWTPCRGIRRQAYWLAGMGSAEEGVRATDVDPMLEESPTSGVEDRLHREMAKLLMADLAVGGDYVPTKNLYRAIQLSKEDKKKFFAAVKEGEEFAIPLMAVATHRGFGLDDALTHFGDDVLMVVEPGSSAVRIGNFSPAYTWDDELENLDGLQDILNYMEERIEEIQDEIKRLDDDEEEDLRFLKEELSGLQEFREEWEELSQQYEATIARIRNQLEQDGFADPQDIQELEVYRIQLQDAIDSGYASFMPRFAGYKIDEMDDDLFWERQDADGPEAMQEFVTGGRFKVIAVEDDPRGRYGKIVRVQQLAVFNPAKSKHMIQTAGAPTPQGKAAQL